MILNASSKEDRSAVQNPTFAGAHITDLTNHERFPETTGKTHLFSEGILKKNAVKDEFMTLEHNILHIEEEAKEPGQGVESEALDDFFGSDDEVGESTEINEESAEVIEAGAQINEESAEVIEAGAGIIGAGAEIIEGGISNQAKAVEIKQEKIEARVSVQVSKTKELHTLESTSLVFEEVCKGKYIKNKENSLFSFVKNIVADELAKGSPPETIKKRVNESIDQLADSGDLKTVGENGELRAMTKEEVAHLKAKLDTSLSQYVGLRHENRQDMLKGAEEKKESFGEPHLKIRAGETILTAFRGELTILSKSLHACLEGQRPKESDLQNLKRAIDMAKQLEQIWEQKAQAKQEFASVGMEKSLKHERKLWENLKEAVAKDVIALGVKLDALLIEIKNKPDVEEYVALINDVDTHLKEAKIFIANGRVRRET